MSKFFKLLIINMMLFTSGFSQFDISVTINGLSNQDIYLAFYYGDKNYVVDTVKLDQNGKGVFKGDKKLEEGIYLVILPSRSYFDIIIDKNTTFAIETDTASDMRVMVNNLTYKNSPVNNQFTEYQKYMFSKTTEAHQLKVQGKDKNLSDKKRKKALENLEKINKQIEEKQRSILNNFPNSLLAKVIKAFDEPIVPKIGEIVNGIKLDSIAQYNYYKEAYFKSGDFNDTRILRTPVFNTKLNVFFDKVIVPHPDSIIRSIDQLISLINGNKEYEQFVLNYVFSKYSNSKYMGFDAITVYLADTFFLTDQADWVTTEFKEKLKARIDKIRPNLIGSIAPKLDKAQTPEGTFYPLHAVQSKYIVVVFWEPNCGHCKKEIPMLLEIYHNYHHLGLEIYAFYTQRDLDSWKKTITDFEIEPWINVYDPLYKTDFRDKYDVYSTPTMYILDQEHKILAKRITIEFLNEFLTEKLKK